MDYNNYNMTCCWLALACTVVGTNWCMALLALLDAMLQAKEDPGSKAANGAPTVTIAKPRTPPVGCVMTNMAGNLPAAVGTSDSVRLRRQTPCF